MTNYRNFSNLTADPTAAIVYSRLADMHDDAARPEGAPHSGMSLAGMRAAMQRVMSAHPEYTGPSMLRA